MVVQTVASLCNDGHDLLGEFLRKEGLYYTMVQRWEHQYEDGLLIAATRGPVETSRASLLEEIKSLRRKLEQTEKRLARTEMIVELQKKLSSILELKLPTIPEPQDEK